jgi:16S rRNA A1518/A1519 N6-dimethyltransferase RsmA/KsgA/DIM1 with predicted DNA glycosylase/AP lyase activity
MQGYDATTYGQRIAEVYDDWHTEAGPEEVELLCELAGEGPVLELGVGTGRLALPLASLGLQMHGIDSSDAMVAKLRERPGGDSVAVTLGDFQDFDLAERFSLVLVVQYVFHTA